MTLYESLASRARRMGEGAFAGIRTAEDWEKVRDGRHGEFLRNLGLDPMPPECDAEIREYGEHAGPGFRMRNIGFQILPDCWASANFYYPDPLPPEPAPGVLYVCGHAMHGTHNYQYNGQMWARRGYACLIVETIEQSDNRGEHHGFQKQWHNHWLSLGYTSAGGETLNSLRALDVLARDPQVDAQRLGATGISGGGALSLYLGILDPRLKAIASLCGISTPHDAIANRRMLGHCDCIYPFNLACRDIAEYAALMAPRAALVCSGDNDALYHPDEIRALGARIARGFELQGAADRFKLLTHDCGHENHPVFFKAVQEWFDLHVAGDERPVEPPTPAPLLAESATNTFKGVPPAPDRLHLLPELASPRGRIALPSDASEWRSIQKDAIASLPPLLVDEPEVEFSRVGRWTGKSSAPSVVSVAFRGRIGGMPVWLDLWHDDPKPGRLVLSIVQGGEYTQHAAARLGPAVRAAGCVFGGLAPRLGGMSSPPAASASPLADADVRDVPSRLLFAMVLTGQTPVTMTLRDIREAIGFLVDEGWGGEGIYLHGRGDQAIASLYLGLVEPRVRGVILEDIPVSHAQGSPITGILRVCDIPDAVGLLAPRPVALVHTSHGNWTYPRRVYERIGAQERLILANEVTQAMRRVVEAGSPISG